MWAVYWRKQAEDAEAGQLESLTQMVRGLAGLTECQAWIAKNGGAEERYLLIPLDICVPIICPEGLREALQRTMTGSITRKNGTAP